jgi:hypothetical protein
MANALVVPVALVSIGVSWVIRLRRHGTPAEKRTDRFAFTPYARAPDNRVISAALRVS